MKRAYVNKKAQLDLNNSVHILGMLVFKCPVDISSTISGQWKCDSIKWTSLSHEKNSSTGGLDPRPLIQQASARITQPQRSSPGENHWIWLPGTYNVCMNAYRQRKC